MLSPVQVASVLWGWKGHRATLELRLGGTSGGHPVPGDALICD